MYKLACSSCFLLLMLMASYDSQAQPNAAILIAKKSAWKYEASGTDLGTAWQQADYNDDNWPSGHGILGFGENYINTALPAGHITYYFRKAFTLAVSPALMTQLTLRANYDDGFVAYLNGQEVARRALPVGPIVFGTPAINHEGGVYEAIDLTAHINKLVTGNNVLAIEVHQNNDQSSDLVMDVELSYQSTPITAGLVRGPYLQLGTPSSMVIRWRTDVATNSQVRYGTDPNNLSWSADDLIPTTDHILKLTNLTPATKYYYSVGTTSGVLASGSDFYFVTNPAADAVKKTRVWVLGDAGTTTLSQRRVRDAYYSFTSSTHTDLWVMLGDNAYNSGRDAEYQTALFDTYPTMLRKSVLWPAFGDHDALSAASPTQSGVYYDIFTLPTHAEAGGVASETEAYYSFDYGNIHFICLNSQDLPRSTTGAMLTWLQQDLAANNKPWTIAFWHHPPYSKGSYDSDKEIQLIEMRRNALPILENGGVDLVLSGHSHSYERSFLLDGHYGQSSTLTNTMIRNGGNGRGDGDGAYIKPAYAPSSRQGTVYVVAGCSGQVSSGAFNHPAMYLSLNALGSVVLEVDSNRVDVKFLDAQGSILDYFTIIKGEDGLQPLPAPGNLSANATGSSTINLTWKDNSNNEEGFKIERKIGNGSFSRIASVGSNVTSYLDNNLSANATYVYRVRAYRAGSHSGYSNEAAATTDTASATNIIPTKPALHQNYPNPFNPSTNIRFDLPYAAHVSVKVLNLMGEEVEILVNEVRPAGVHIVTFNARRLPSGFYFYELRAGNHRLTRQLLLTK